MVARYRDCRCCFAWPTGSALARTDDADAAQRFVTGELRFNCFDGSRGAGRIYGDGSVIGSIQFRGSGPVRSVWLPAGTLRVQAATPYCAALNGMTYEPCFEARAAPATTASAARPTGLRPGRLRLHPAP